MKLEKIGVQLYTIRGFLDTEEAAKVSFEKLKKLGYDEAQTAGCVLPYETFGKIARDAGITLVGTHDNFDLMLNDPDEAMKNHDYLGTKIMGIGGFFKSTKEEYEDFIAKANVIAKNIKSQGFKFTYHNHSHEFRKLDGKLIMDILAEGMDPESTGFVLDTYWVQHGGGDVRAWIEKLAGRIDILHLKDMGVNENGPFITECGNGNINFDGIIPLAEACGVKHFCVEQDIWPGDAMDSAAFSAQYLKKFML